MNKKSKHKLKYLGNEKSFWNKIKSIFILSKGLLFSKSCFRSESVPLNNYEKYFQFSMKKSFFYFRDIKVFVFPTSPQFFPVSPCLRGWFKINIKVYDTSICLNKNLITYFVWYLEKEKDMTLKLCQMIEYYVWNIFTEKSCRNYAPKASSKLFLILENNPKQPLHARKCFENKTFWKRIIKKP